LYQFDISRAVWWFEYISTSAPTLEIFVDALTGGIVTGVEAKPQETAMPQNYGLKQNFPNPFNPETMIEYELPQAANIEIIIFNLQGKKIATVIKNYQAAGFHQVKWGGKDEHGHSVTSGVYLLQLKADGFTTVKKMLLLR